MKNTLEMLDKIAEAANGQEIKVTIRTATVFQVKECVKMFDSNYFEPATHLPSYWTIFQYKNITVSLSTPTLKAKTVTTFETV